MSDMKSIWHKLPEQPEKGRDVLEKWHHLGIHYTHFVAKNGIAEDNPFTDAWCYLDDLLACEKELANTKKKLDMANAELDYIQEQIAKNKVFESEGLQKKLDIAVNALKWIDETYELGMGYEAAIREKCQITLEQINNLPS